MMNFYEFFIEPWSYAFMLRSLIVSLLIGTVCAVFSCYLILKGWSLLGDAASHAVLPGIALAYLLNIPLIIGAFSSAILCSYLTRVISKNTRIKEDTAIGITFSALFGLGLVLITLIESDIHLSHILFGNMLGVSEKDIIAIGFICFLAFIIILLKRKDLTLYCFDENQAQVMGLNIHFLYFLLMVLLSLTIVASLSAVGIILVTSMLITPGAVGFLTCKRFDHMMMVAIAVSVSSCILGSFLSFHWDVDTAPLIIFIQFIIFVFTFLKNSQRLSNAT